MRKGIGEGGGATKKFSVKVLEKFKQMGYRYVQVKGLTPDNHYEYIEPSKFVLIPMRELPADQAGKDIYEPIGSDLLASWAVGKDGVQVFV